MTDPCGVCRSLRIVRCEGAGFSTGGDASLELEVMGFAGPDVKKGVAALRAKHPPKFESDSPC